MATYEFETTVRIMTQAESEEEAHSEVEGWLQNNVFDYGAIVEVS